MSKKNNSKLDESKQPLLKILMIHGYRQSESAFRERTGGLRKSLKSHVEFVFCEAPLDVPKLDCPLRGENKDELEQNLAEKGWWFSQADSYYNALDKTDCDLGFEQSLNYINSVFESQGPFDGILGFSQGACLAGILCKIAELNAKNDDSQKYKSIRFNFAILVAGFKSGQSTHNIYYDLVNKVQLPSMHIFGETDKVIPFEMSEELTNYFDNKKIFKHTAGHLVPVNAEAKNNFIDFFNQIRANKQI